MIYFFVACTLCPKTKLPLEYKRAFTPMGENPAKSDILLVAAAIVVPKGGGSRYNSTTGQSNHEALTFVPNFQFQTTSDLLDR